MMEKFEAEGMEVKLFLFTVLQIHLFSPWSAGRGLLQWHPGGTGRWRGLGCFTRTLRMPRLGLTGQPGARRETLVEAVQHGLLPCWEASSVASCRHIILSLTYHDYPFAVLSHTKTHVKWGEGARGADSSWQHQSLVPKPGC